MIVRVHRPDIAEIIAYFGEEYACWGNPSKSCLKNTDKSPCRSCLRFAFGPIPREGEPAPPPRPAEAKSGAPEPKGTGDKGAPTALGVR